MKQPLCTCLPQALQTTYVTITSVVIIIIIYSHYIRLHVICFHVTDDTKLVDFAVLLIACRVPLPHRTQSILVELALTLEMTTSP